MRLSPTLTLSSLVIWYSEQTALFFFVLERASPAYLPETVLSVALRPLFPFQQAQYVQVFPLKPAPFCTLFAGLGSTNKSAASLLLLSNSRSVLSYIFSSTSNSVADLAGTVFFSPRVLSDYNGSPDTRFSRGTTRLMIWPDRGALLAPSAIPCSLSSLISCIHSCLFWDWRRTVSSKFFNTQVPSISTEERVLPRHDHCVLSRLRCNGDSLLLSSYLSRIGRNENSSCSTCRHSSQDTSHLILHCPVSDSLRLSLFGDSLSLHYLWSGPWRVNRLLGLH